MSTLKLSTTAASIHVRSATTKSKTLFFSPNRTTTIHDHRRTTHVPPLSPKPLIGFTICKTPSSFLTRAVSSTVPPQPHPPEPEPEPEPSKLLTLPTILTLGRVAAVPLLVATFYMDGWRGTAATTSIFIAASVTDWLDGYIARKMKLESSFGAFLDPVADKLMVAATLVLLCTRPLAVDVFGQAPWLLTLPSIAIIGREITMSAVREWAASQIVSS
uniref:Uncharacterized protein n=1 Tax=Lotus japonicus TaxID=34305 RepID=I3SDB6_LOTJA|nr:unknown [Lotus japonicus]